MALKRFYYYLSERFRRLINSKKKKHPLSSLPTSESMTEEESELIKARLKELGYIDEDEKQ